MEASIDVFGGDDGIIDHDADHDNEAEDAHHIGGDAEPGHHDEAPGEGYGDADHDPKSDAGPQEQAQYDKHQQAALGETGQQGSQTALELN